MLKSIYLSPIGYIISFLLNILAPFSRPFMVYGYFDRKRKRFLRNTRISSNAKILHSQNLDISDNCWIGHHCLIDASGGLTIGEGVQISSLNAVLTHSSHISIRLLGNNFLEKEPHERLGYILSPVIIGDYTFIGSGAIILPGTIIGKGCVIGAGSIVKGKIPDYSLVIGNPGKIVGTVEKFDSSYLHIEGIDDTYFDKHYLNFLKKSI